MKRDIYLITLVLQKVGAAVPVRLADARVKLSFTTDDVSSELNRIFRINQKLKVDPNNLFEYLLRQ